MSGKPFLDTNVLVYAFADGDRRQPEAERLIASGGIVSVQVLNEFVNVARRKRGRGWPEVLEELRLLGRALEVVPMLVDTHRAAIDIAMRHGFSFYDSLILAAAQMAGCRVLMTEDLQHGRAVDGVSIRNPFLA